MFAKAIVCFAVAVQAVFSQCPPCGVPAPACYGAGPAYYGAGAIAAPPPATYQVALNTCGPEPTPTLPVNAPSVNAPAIVKPTVSLPASIPATRTIAASASCVKTVLKPQLYQQLVSVPIISKYLQTLSRPVTETITFEAVPVCPAGPSPYAYAAPSPLAYAAPAPLAYAAPAPVACAAPAPLAYAPPAPVAYAAPAPCAYPAPAPPCGCY